MKKMIKNQNNVKKHLHTKRYLNGQLGVFVQEGDGEPIAELSIMNYSTELAPNEFILKDYSENEKIAQKLIDSQLIIPTDRFILIGTHLCPICKIES